MKHRRSCSKCLPSFATQALVRLAQKSRTRFRIHEFPERRFERNNEAMHHIFRRIARGISSTNSGKTWVKNIKHSNGEVKHTFEVIFNTLNPHVY
jgi:hypothetical protein